MQEPIKFARILLTLMLGCPEYKYWEKDNDDLIIPDKAMSSWVAVINALEALLEDLDEDFPQKDK